MWRSPKATVLAAGLFAFASQARAEGPRRFDVEPGQAMVNVTLGTTSQVSAVSLGLEGSLHESNEQLRAELRVPLKSFASGKTASDAKVLAAADSAESPILLFEGTGQAPGQDGRTRFTGQLTLHGVTQPIEVPATLTRIGDRIYVHASFPLPLGKFGVKLPGLGGLLHIDLDASLRPVPETLASSG